AGMGTGTVLSSPRCATISGDKGFKMRDENGSPFRGEIAALIKALVSVYIGLLDLPPFILARTRHLPVGMADEETEAESIG
ncbi:MAG: hypothetical protein OSB57_08655, partial [Planctomycetota bacterium]|nr:hypothetical protein [Planctomycetota bacterium]